MALVDKVRPIIPLVDKPTGNLDTNNDNQVIELISTFNEDEKTICMVTHDSRYENLAKRQWYLLDGK
jgi:putative ABC transport system ATP-binding protein